MDVTSSQEDYYFTLGVEDTATTEEISYAYHTLMKRCHPDLNEGNAWANERGKRINEAYEVLSDPKRRADYDNRVNGTSPSSSIRRDTAGANQDDADRTYGQSSGSWYREEAILQKAREERPSVNPLGEADVLEQCFRQQNLLRRLLAPRDLLLVIEGQGSETFTCLRATTDFLDRRVFYQTGELTMDHWVDNQARIRSTSDNLNYIPTEFDDERVEIFEDATEIDCAACNGLGYEFCPPTVSCSPTRRCGDCRGDGAISKGCTRCGGRGQREFLRNCSKCEGSGWIGEFDSCNLCWEGQISSKRPCSACGGRGGQRSKCASCGGQGIVTCIHCSGRGFVTCKRCDGLGRIDCAGCATHGRLMQVHFRIHDFKKRSVVCFASETRQANRFEQGLRNELAEDNFAGFTGELVLEDQQRPESSDVVRQRRRIESFAISSFQFQYDKKRVTINQINGAGSNYRLYAPAGLPISLGRLSIAVIAGIALLIGAIILLGHLAA